MFNRRMYATYFFEQLLGRPGGVSGGTYLAIDCFDPRAKCIGGRRKTMATADDSTMTTQEAKLEQAAGSLAPTQPKSLGFQLTYGGANSIIGLTNITLYTVLLPVRIGQLAPANETNIFIIITGLGALASVLTNPLVGALSDRTTSALGRRLPWLLVGMSVMLISMLTLAFAPSVLILGFGTVLLQVAINAILAALSAVIPDQVPNSQKGTVSAFGGMSPLLGTLIGQFLVLQVLVNTTTSLLVLPMVSIVLLIFFILVLQEKRLKKEDVTPFHLKDIARAYWLSPRRYPDFARVWGARCCIFLAWTTVVSYMYFFILTDRLAPPSQVAQGVQIWYLVAVLFVFASALLFGKLSDIWQRRKIFVIWASLLMAAALVVYAFFPNWPIVLGASAFLGVGFGAYISVDLALAAQLLPSERHFGKDIGLINTAIFLPMLVQPFLAEAALTWLHSFQVLFLMLAVAAALSAVLIRPIRGVR
jgi:MFS family permease